MNSLKLSWIIKLLILLGFSEISMLIIVFWRFGTVAGSIFREVQSRSAAVTKCTGIPKRAFYLYDVALHRNKRLKVHRYGYRHVFGITKCTNQKDRFRVFAKCHKCNPIRITNGFVITNILWVLVDGLRTNPRNTRYVLTNVKIDCFDIINKISSQ